MYKLIFPHTPFNPALFCAKVTGMIQDIKPHNFNNQFHRGKRVKPSSVILIFDGDRVLLQATASVEIKGAVSKKKSAADSDYPYCLPTASSLSFPKEKVPDAADPLYLFSLDHTDFFLADKACAKNLPGTDTAPDTKSAQSTSSDTDGDTPFIMLPAILLRRQHLLPKHLIFAVLTALHLSRWYTENVYCGTCATKTEHADDERALVCPNCGRRIYPKIMPAVIVGITDKNKIVLTKYANRPVTSYALVAGFNEIGETLEETVGREVMEEVGLRVKNIRYYKSQPWAIAGDILTGYFCDVDGDTAIHIDNVELKEAAWFKREDVVLQPDDFSLTNEMMMVFKEGREPASPQEEKR